ncbi:uncharacterized protein [Diadema antillarum]|uniref:uncharacterized protein n=1 Tax=Diadema antillarum TaxID=105358 RepID=UPI003A869AA1
MALHYDTVISSGFTDTTPPVVTCSDVTLGQPFVNVFFGLTLNNGYTYDDVNPNFNGVSYSLPTGPFGHRYPPGDTVVTLFARDLCDNVATCDFTVNNPLTELPVNCPDLTDTVSLSPGQATYTYTPTFGPGDVTLTTGVNYQYIGDNGVMVAVNVGVGNEAPVGVNQITTVISDDVLSKTCTSTLTVEDNEAPTVICPADATLSQSNLVYPEATASDNADPSPTVTYDPPASSLSLGTTTVTVNVTDSSSNSASCEFNVTVIVRDNNDSRQGEDGERLNDDPNQNRRDNLAAMIVPPVVVVVIILVVVIVVAWIVLTRRRRRKYKSSDKAEGPDRLECDAIKKDPEL